jgi:DNA-binding PucR family transcriptional regulator
VHHKTLRYRLDKIEELTGLDLTRHSERMRASIALDLLALQDI